MIKIHNPRRLKFEILESRVLFSASLAPAPSPDGGGDAGDAGSPVQEQPATQEENQSPPAEQGSNENPAPPTETSGATIPQEQAVSGSTDPGTVVAEVQQEQIETIGHAAAEIWTQAGVDQYQLERLSKITYSVENFQGSVLSASEGNHIFIDIDAAGAGWFVDSTPLFSEEFVSSGSATQLFGETAGSQTAIDLLTVILHEQGHILGLPDDFSGFPDIMGETIAIGERLLPIPGQADGSASPSYEVVEYAVAGSGIILDSPAFPSQVSVGETAVILGSFQNTTGNPVTVELLDANRNLLDSVIVNLPDTQFSFSITPAQAGLLKVTIYAYDPLDPLVSLDSADIPIQVVAAQIPVATPPTTTPPATTTPTTTTASPTVTQIVAPVEPPSETLAIPATVALIEVPVVSTPSVIPFPTQVEFLEQFGGSAMLSQQLFGTGGLFYVNLNQVIFSQILANSQPIKVTLYDQNDEILGIQDFDFSGDFNIISSISLLDQLEVNSQSLGLARIEIKHARGSSYFDYVAGSFLEASAMKTGSLPLAFAAGRAN